MKKGFHNGYGLAILALICLMWMGSTWWIQLNRTRTGKKLFSLSSEKIVAIRMRHGEDTVYLKQGKDDLWQVRNKKRYHEVNTTLLRSLFYVIDRARQKQEAHNEEIQAETSLNHAYVTFWTENEDSIQYHLVGNKEEGKSYAVLGPEEKNPEGWRVEIPGYDVYAWGIFFLRTEQWRHRQIFSLPRTWQSIAVKYAAIPSNNLLFRATESGVEMNIAQYDSAKVNAYLKQFAQFFTNEYIDAKQVPRYDSLRNHGMPVAEIIMHTLRAEAPTHITIYYAKKDAYYLLQEADSSLSLCEKERFDAFLRKKEDFMPAP